MTARYIAIDWGSTNLRAWLYQGDHCLESRQSEAGVTRLNGKSPAAVLAEVTTDWREENTPVVMAGMVGSNVGWKVAPYLSVPARFSSIGEQLTSVGDNIWIIPGLCVSHDDNHNVMRGEETQLIGARALAPSSLYVMPGTHCKWVQADSQQINDFRTVMTGELHHLLLNHSLIGAGLPPQENSADAFAAGLERGLNAPAILPQLFEVRASHVLGTLPREQVSEFLSGLLIGAEVASMRDYVTHQHAITLVAGTSLTARYQQAFTALEAGAQALKIFPSSAFGPQYIKALKAVLPPDIAVFAVGGVTPENLAQWIDAGCVGAGLGSDLYRAGQSVERTAQQAAAFVKAYREAVQ
ncbi:TPA: 2-oxo-3-deoxygalactonate kinase [Shigella flexneri]|nr:2-oxo-3-deoxygalactonate kinase [Shigella flexneri]